MPAIEELLHAAFDAAPLPAVLADGPEHLLVAANDACVAEFGTVALRLPVARALPELAGTGLAAALDQVYDTGRPVLLEERLVRLRGADRYFSIVCVPARGGVAVFCRDETERVRRDEALAEEEARNRNMAVALQRSLLPQRIVQPDEIRLAACYLPALVRYEDSALDDEPVLEVGGDWYDAIPLGAGRTALVVGGVTPEAGGVGVRAAAVMGRLRAAVRAYASQNLPPGEVMYHLDRHALEFDGERTGAAVATLVYAVHDADTGALTYANAGHLPPLLRLPDGYVVTLEGASGPSLGTGDWTWQEAAVAVPPGSYLAFTPRACWSAEPAICGGCSRGPRRRSRRGPAPDRWTWSGTTSWPPSTRCRSPAAAWTRPARCGPTTWRCWWRTPRCGPAGAPRCSARPRSSWSAVRRSPRTPAATPPAC
ncbi:PP2C family protein-serine/threonine phosphatase [Catenulispora yoronensis]